MGQGMHCREQTLASIKSVLRNSPPAAHPLPPAAHPPRNVALAALRVYGVARLCTGPRHGRPAKPASRPPLCPAPPAAHPLATPPRERVYAQIDDRRAPQPIQRPAGRWPNFLRRFGGSLGVASSRRMILARLSQPSAAVSRRLPSRPLVATPSGLLCGHRNQSGRPSFM
jgi:hypothetical protein